MAENFTEEEKHVLGIMGVKGFYKPGSFTIRLVDTIFHADVMNSAKLRQVFPGYVDAVKAWQYGDLAQRAGVD